MVFWDVIAYIVLAFGLWIGTGLIISAIERFTKNLGLSRFAVSFFILGILTSIPEFAVGVTSILEGKPEVFAGNLLGGIPVLFLFVIPILAIFGRRIIIHNEFKGLNMTASSIVIALPSMFALDRVITYQEGGILILFYIAIFLFIEGTGGLLSVQRKKKKVERKLLLSILPKMLLGIGIVFVSSHYILGKTLEFASLIGIAPFYVSLIALSLGTNIPELSIALRAIFQGKKDIAFGDYMGSAAANSLFFGIFTIFNRGQSFKVESFVTTFVFIVGGMLLFYIFSRSKRDISRKEGIILFAMYVIFAFLELRK